MRLKQLEAEQSVLWCKIAFRAVAGRELLRKSLYRFDLKATDSSTGSEKVECLRATMGFLRMANQQMEDAEKLGEDDQARFFGRMQESTSLARKEFDEKLVRQTSLVLDLESTTTPLGRFAAVAKRMDDVAKNIADAMKLSTDGDRADDEQRKNTFRSLLQESIINYAEAVLAGDECANAMAREWKVLPDVEKSLTATTVRPGPAAEEPSQAKSRSAAVMGTNAGVETQNSTTPSPIAAGPATAKNAPLPGSAEVRDASPPAISGATPQTPLARMKATPTVPPPAPAAAPAAFRAEPNTDRIVVLQNLKWSKFLAVSQNGETCTLVEDRAKAAMRLHFFEENVVSIEPLTHSGQYLTVIGTMVNLRPASNSTPAERVRFRVVTALATPDADYVSFESLDKPGTYLIFNNQTELWSAEQVKQNGFLDWVSYRVIPVSSSATPPSASAPPTRITSAPRVVLVSLANGSTTVDPGITELRVTFDQPMSTSGYSWCGGGPTFPGRPGAKPRWLDDRTCVLPISLAPNSEYRVSLNCPSYSSFRSSSGVPLKPYPITFRTAGR